MNALFDSNILIDFLNGIVLAQKEIRRHDERAISIVTWIEVLAGAKPERQAETRRFLGRFRRVPISSEIAERAVIERQRRRIKLPDAMIIATAAVEGQILITRNTKDFPATDKNIRVPYRLTMQ